MGDDLDELVVGDAVVDGAAEVAGELLGAVEGDEGGDGDEGAVTLGQPGAFPDVADAGAIGSIQTSLVNVSLGPVLVGAL